MSIIVVTKRARSTDLTLLATFKTEPGLSGSGDDTFIATLIKQASGAIYKYLGRDLARQVLHEGTSSFDRTVLIVSLTPVLSVSKVTQRAYSFDPVTYFVSDAEAGFIYNEDGWGTSEVIGFPSPFSVNVEKLPSLPNPNIFYVDYTGGYLMPGDDISGSVNISFAAADQSLNLNSGKFPILVPGDVIVVSGAAPASDNGSFTVATATDSKITVSDGALVDAASGTAVSVAVRSLPYDIERACIETMKGWYFGRDRDWTTKLERIGGTRAGAWQAEYDPSAALPPQAVDLLSRYRRVF